MQRARSVTGQLTVAIARQHMIIAVAKYDGEIRRRADVSDLHAADVRQMPGLRIGGEIDEELAIARPREQVGDALAREYPPFLLPQLLECLCYVARFRGGHEADLAVRGHAPALGAVAPPRRRRPLSPIEGLPIAAQLRDVRAVGVGRDAEMSEGIDLDADGLRHLLELDPVGSDLRIGLQPLAQLPPHGEEAARRDTLREFGR